MIPCRRPVLPVIIRLLSALLLILLPAWAAVSSASPPAEQEQRIAADPSTRELIDYALHRNPAIQAARYSWKAVVERYRLDTALADPELFGSYAVDAKNTASLMDWQIGVSQTFPFPGTLAGKGEVAEADARIARLEFQKAARDVVVQVRQSVAELVYVRTARLISLRNQELLDQLVSASVAASAQDRGTSIDLAKAQAQAAQVQYDGLLLAELETTEVARLNALLARPSEAVIGPLALDPILPVVYDLAGLRRLAGESFEELRLADAEIVKAEALIKLGAFVTGSREESGMVAGDYTSKSGVGLEAGISIPFWLGKNHGRRAAAEAESLKARAGREAKGNEINAELSSAYFRLRNSERLLTLYEKNLLPQATRAIATAETWVREGQGSFSDLIETRTVFYNFELALARARADYAKYLARLEQLCGRSVTTATPVGPAASPQIEEKP